jgi:hypothetical protein
VRERLLRSIESHLAEAPDTVTNDTCIDWAIPLIKASLQKRFS